MFPVVGGNCQSPTQPQPELELDWIMGRKPPTHPTHHSKKLEDDLKKINGRLPQKNGGRTQFFFLN